MAETVAIVTDSIACLTREIVEQYGIGTIPINFYAGGKLYKDWVDITPTEAYKLFLKDPESLRQLPPRLRTAFKPTAKPANKPRIFFLLLSRLNSAPSIM